MEESRIMNSRKRKSILIVLIAFAVIAELALFFSFRRIASAPQVNNAAPAFRGPVGAPFVKGPTGPPPGSK